MSKTYTVTLALPDGKRKYFRGSTKREAEEKRDKARIQLAMGLNLSDHTKVADYVETWLRDYKKGSVRDVSYERIETRIRLHVLPYIGNLYLKDVKPAHIQRVMREASNLSKSTQAHILCSTREMFETALENDLISKNPCSKSIKAKGKDTDEKDPLTPTQEQELLEAARGTNIYLFVLLGLYSGLRRGELLGLQWGDINFDSGVLSVRRMVAIAPDGGSYISDDLKTDAAYRDVPLPNHVLQELKEHKAKAKSLFLLPGQRTPYLQTAALQKRWSNLIDTLSFDATPHLMRHTRITRWFEQGLDIKEVQYLAGHSDAGITLKVYTHYDRATRFNATAEKIRIAYV